MGSRNRVLAISLLLIAFAYAAVGVLVSDFDSYWVGPAFLGGTILLIGALIAAVRQLFPPQSLSPQDWQRATQSILKLSLQVASARNADSA